MYYHAPQPEVHQRLRQPCIPRCRAPLLADATCALRGLRMLQARHHLGVTFDFPHLQQLTLRGVNIAQSILDAILTGCSVVCPAQLDATLQHWSHHR